MTTITRGKHAASPVATIATKTTEIVDLDAEMTAVFDELSEATLARQLAESREKELKAMIMAMIPEDQEPHVTFALRVANSIRGKVSVRSRAGVDQKTLKEAFPEAYEATRTSSTYKVFTA